MIPTEKNVLSFLNEGIEKFLPPEERIAIEVARAYPELDEDALDDYVSSIIRETLDSASAINASRTVTWESAFKTAKTRSEWSSTTVEDGFYTLEASTTDTFPSEISLTLKVVIGLEGLETGSLSFISDHLRELILSRVDLQYESDLPHLEAAATEYVYQNVDSDLDGTWYDEEGEEVDRNDWIPEHVIDLEARVTSSKVLRVSLHGEGTEMTCKWTFKTHVNGGHGIYWAGDYRFEQFQRG